MSTHSDATSNIARCRIIRVARRTFEDLGLDPEDAELIISDKALRNALIRREYQERHDNGEKAAYLHSVIADKYGLKANTVRHIVG